VKLNRRVSLIGYCRSLSRPSMPDRLHAAFLAPVASSHTSCGTHRRTPDLRDSVPPACVRPRPRVPARASAPGRERNHHGCVGRGRQHVGRSRAGGKATGSTSKTFCPGFGRTPPLRRVGEPARAFAGRPRVCAARRLRTRRPLRGLRGCATATGKPRGAPDHRRDFARPTGRMGPPTLVATSLRPGTKKRLLRWASRQHAPNTQFSAELTGRYLEPSRPGSRPESHAERAFGAPARTFCGPPRPSCPQSDRPGRAVPQGGGRMRLRSQPSSRVARRSTARQAHPGRLPAYRLPR